MHQPFSIFHVRLYGAYFLTYFSDYMRNFENPSLQSANRAFKFGKSLQISNDDTLGGWNTGPNYNILSER